MIDHLAFVVSDPEQTAKTLAKFGYQVHRKTNHHSGSVEVIDPAQPNLVLELCTKREQDELGFNHAGLCIAGSEAAAALKEQGISFLKEPHLSVETGRYVANFLDADGTKWQISY